VRVKEILNKKYILKRLEKVEDQVAEKKKQIQNINEALKLLSSTKEELVNEWDDLLSERTYLDTKIKEIS
jgi:chromosome segregation ATPase